MSDRTEHWRLADGEEVSEPVARVTMLGLRQLLTRHGAVAAIDMRDLADGKQPARSPFIDHQEYANMGLCDVADEAGRLIMHDTVAAVVRNAVHVNPGDPFDFRFVDPREPFSGFES